MDTSLLLDDIDKVETVILAAAIAYARMTGLIFIMPAFSRLGLTGILRSSVALVLSLPILPMVYNEIVSQNMHFGMMASILFKEVVVGVIIGLVLGIPIWAAEAAGEILDLQRGLSFAETVDPLEQSQNNISGTFLSIHIVAIFFVSGGLTMVMNTTYNSYALWPLTNFMPIFSAEAGGLFLKLLDEILGKGLLLIAPVFIALLLSDLALAFVSRAAPQMNTFVLSLTVKNLAYTLLMVLYTTFLVSYMRKDLSVIWNADKTLKVYAPSRI